MKGEKRAVKSAGRKYGQEGRKMAVIQACTGSDADPETRQNDSEDEQQDCCAIMGAMTGDEEPNNPEISIVRMREILEELDEEMTQAQEKKLTKIDVPTLDITFGTVHAKALVDTGAQVTAMSEEFYGRIRKIGMPIQIQPIRKFTLRGAFAEKGTAIAAKIRVAFRHEGGAFVHEFYVVDRLAFEIVLGIDFLMKYQMRMSCEESVKVKFRESAGITATIHAIGREQAESNLENLLNSHHAVFDGEIGRVGHYEHRIEVLSDRPFKRKTYPIAEKHLKSVRKYMRELEEKEIIAKEATQYINPLVVVMKRNGAIRLCLDARELNKIMINDHAQPSTIEEVFRRVGKNRYFTTLDVNNAFWQIPLEQQSRKYTGFIFDGQTYVFNRMPFGLKTAGASFTRAMEQALEASASDFLTVYLDDVLIASATLEEHLWHLNMVLTKLTAAGFKLNRDKCEFLKRSIRFLGHTFNEVTAEINEDTRHAIATFERPKNKKAIQVFLGLVNWDRRFIKDMARMTRPLEELLRKGRKFKWTSEQQGAFNEIKQAFQEATELFLIRKGHEFGIYVDAARTGLGARLYQYQPGDNEKR